MGDRIVPCYTQILIYGTEIAPKDNHDNNDFGVVFFSAPKRFMDLRPM